MIRERGEIKTIGIDRHKSDGAMHKLIFVARDLARGIELETDLKQNQD